MDSDSKGDGLVMVYTGDGKGKTTAALGQALRAIGHGGRVFMIQFMKGSRNYGEIQAVERYLPRMTIIQSGLDSFVDRSNPSEADIALARQGLALAREKIASGLFDLVILDEINVAVDYGLVSLGEVVEVVRGRPPGIDLVLTGRYAPREILELADLVSEVREVKHHYRKGIQARAGVEF